MNNINTIKIPNTYCFAEFSKMNSCLNKIKAEYIEDMFFEKLYDFHQCLKNINYQSKYIKKNENYCY